eukprot:GAFH01005750.1.p1 GENE.GAFH01005750.1~~GAFH01005750.1.p1  ORF type:complete len:195 (+),score=3.25 GAFH01005750.1:90-587(+)
MVGLDAAGKTTILYKVKSNENITTTPTIGFNLEEVDIGSIRFTVWDVGGQKQIRQLWSHYYENSNAVIFVVDSADTARLSCATGTCNDCARCELHTLMQNDTLANATLLVFANKQDIPGALPPDQVAERLKLSDMGATRKVHIQPCCALQGQGLHEGFNWLSQNC